VSPEAGSSLLPIEISGLVLNMPRAIYNGIYGVVVKLSSKKIRRELDASRPPGQMFDYERLSGLAPGARQFLQHPSPEGSN